jgi:enoyl-CoA hydratase/carnithine racemase
MTNPGNSPGNSPGASVLLFEHEARGGHIVAEARLNAAATLNALTLEMIDILTPALQNWSLDDSVVAVVVTGSGERAFSAGGDVQALYLAMESNHHAGDRVDDYPYDFFEREYRLDYLLHNFPKPLVAVGHGVIMGGGLGLFSAASIRIVTENVRIAFPEVTIGLFPDAGGTWLLRNIEPHLGLFLGMTGSQVNGADALLLGLGTHAVAREDLDQLLSGILGLGFDAEPTSDGQRISEYLFDQRSVTMPEAELPNVSESVTVDDDLADVVSWLRGLAGRSAWIDKGLATLERGCPTTVGIVHEQIKRGRGMSLADCFRLEMTVATHCADNHDFSEGVRALLIDKDNQPNWQFGDLESLPHDYVADHFEEPWSVNPLHDLETTT